jgi:NAD-dependent SIR2 family protein deacetylase
MNNQVEQLAAMIRNASRIVAFTGAGISAESGIPTYRGEGGLWHDFFSRRFLHTTPLGFGLLTYEDLIYPDDQMS